jgi:2,3-dihydroxy-2,3-dihydrophenylpropionate dehydrogenase
MTDPPVAPVALVTGAANGIGNAIVHDLAAHGYQVLALDLVPATGLPAAVDVLVGDVCSPQDNERAVATALDRHGRLDVFIGNAGLHDGGVRLTELAGPELAALARRVLEVDVIGYLLGARAAAEALRASRGSIVFTLSDASFVVTGNGSGVVYTAAKHAGLGVMRHLAAELAPSVRVNGVAPGGVLTDLQAAVGEHELRPVYEQAAELAKEIRAHNPLGVLLTPAQLAPLYRFLASDAAFGFTGEVLRPDGGLAVR